jgi:hypothetical protein
MLNLSVAFQRKHLRQSEFTFLELFFSPSLFQINHLTNKLLCSKTMHIDNEKKKRDFVIKQIDYLTTEFCYTEYKYDYSNNARKDNEWN